MGAPQIVLIVLMAIGLTTSLCLHGQTFRLSFWSKLAAAAINLSVLYWGGFFG